MPQLLENATFIKNPLVSVITSVSGIYLWLVIFELFGKNVN